MRPSTSRRSRRPTSGTSTGSSTIWSRRHAVGAVPVTLSAAVDEDVLHISALVCTHARTCTSMSLSMAQAIKSEGGFVWACKNYDGALWLQC